MEDWYEERLVDASAVRASLSRFESKTDDHGRRLGFAPFALALAVLLHIKRQRLAPLEGWVGKGVTWLDADYERSESKSEAGEL